jgi:phosphoribosylformimino-5-aminoimidazole carboxamide ribotide isomerase
LAYFDPKQLDMLLIPAIDLLNRRVVRLLEGDYNAVTYYDHSPKQLLEGIQTEGLRRVHLVDLNRAKSDGDNLNLVMELAPQAHTAGLSVQLGGGLRCIEAVAEARSLGVQHPVVSTAAVLDPNFLTQVTQVIDPSDLILAPDVRDREIYTHGWTRATGIRIQAFMDRALGLGFHQFLITDIAMDGTLRGPSFDLYYELRRDYPAAFIIASGGIGSIQDAHDLARSGVSAAVVGRAWLSGAISTAELAAFNQQAVVA